LLFANKFEELGMVAERARSSRKQLAGGTWQFTDFYNIVSTPARGSQTTFPITGSTPTTCRKNGTEARVSRLLSPRESQTALADKTKSEVAKMSWSRIKDGYAALDSLYGSTMAKRI
jgi:hypothetical protein